MVKLIEKLDLNQARRRAVIYSYLLNKRLSRQIKRLTNPHVVQVYKASDDYDSHLVDDLALTINRDPHPGVH
jgi:hypothetical protein